MAGRRWGLRTFDNRLLIAPAALLLVVRVVQSHHYLGGFDNYVYWRGVREFLRGGNPYLNKDFVTPPSGLVAMLPMRLAEFDPVYIGMQVVTTVAIVGGLYVLLRHLLDASGVASLTLAMVITAVAAPTFTTIGFGSLNGLIFLSTALAIVASRSGDERATGVWLGVGLALKPVLVPFWVVFVIQRRYRAAMWSFVPVVVGSLVAIVINPETIHFVDDGMPNIVSGLENRFRRFNITIGAFVDAAHIPDALKPVGRAGAAALTVAVAFLVWRRYNDTIRSVTAEWIDLSSVLFVGTLLASGFAWRYYVIFLFPLFALACRRGALAHHPLVVVGVLMAGLPDGIGLADTLPRVVAVGRHTSGVALILIGVGLNALRRPRVVTPLSASPNVAVS